MYVAAQRVQAAARARAARAAARALRARSLARRFRPTATRSGAAVNIARVARSFLSRRHFGRGGEHRENRAAAAAAADAAAYDATTTSETPISAKPATRRGSRSDHKPALVDDDSDDAGGYSDDDDDGSRSCLTPHSHPDLGYYSEMALTAADEPEDDKPDDDDYKKHMPEVDGGDMLLSKTPTATEEADARKVGVSQTITEIRNYRRRTDCRMQKWMTHNIIHKRTFQNI